jgi:hypothetical protein
MIGEYCCSINNNILGLCAYCVIVVGASAGPDPTGSTCELKLAVDIFLEAAFVSVEIALKCVLSLAGTGAFSELQVI